MIWFMSWLVKWAWTQRVVMSNWKSIWPIVIVMFPILREWPEWNRQRWKNKNNPPQPQLSSGGFQIAVRSPHRSPRFEGESSQDSFGSSMPSPRHSPRKRGAQKTGFTCQPRMTAVMSPHGQREVERKLEIKILPLLASWDDSLFRRKIYERRRQCQGRK